ncbi:MULTISPECIES: flagellar filament capping protein FliD [unclassified Caballeronia]|uniref:flagellar filament capping protein FliD n=1 Tax=unclassified Caballeronia TaxID=2646786 RepID=UPI0020278227|nr:MULTISPECIES: flagellar filament capping protein FliD [unclassified Caballeronia]
MSTISTATTAATAAQTQASANAALAEAAQSIISGATGNSSMDVNALVTAMVNAKTAGQSASLAAAQSNDNTKLSAIGTLSSALSTLQTTMTSLTDGSLMSTFTTNVTGTGITASGAAGAVAGSYDVTVSQIAKAQSLTSTGFATDEKLGTGTMQISVGSKSMSLNITSSNNTLSGIAAAINNASGNPGVSATIVTGTDGQHLVLNSTTTGASNVISTTITGAASGSDLNKLGVSSTAGANGAASTISDDSVTNGWSQSATAQDAMYKVGGVAGTSSSNTVTSAIKGVTLNLTAAAVTTPASTQTVTISQDTSSISSAISNFVSLYNTVVSTINSYTSFNSSASAGSQGGVLLGNSAVNTIKNQLSAIIGSAVGKGSGSISLASLGISQVSSLDATAEQPAGTLTIDSDKLTDALTNNATGVSQLFNAINGVGAQLTDKISSYLSTGGLLTSETDSINKDLANISTQQTTLTNYAAQLTSDYNAQFTALNTLMASMNQNTQYLTALFGGTNSAGAMATNKS